MSSSSRTTTPSGILDRARKAKRRAQWQKAQRKRRHLKALQGAKSLSFVISAEAGERLDAIIQESGETMAEALNRLICGATASPAPGRATPRRRSKEVLASEDERAVAHIRWLLESEYKNRETLNEVQGLIEHRINTAALREERLEDWASVVFDELRLQIALWGMPKNEDELEGLHQRAVSACT